MDKWVAKLGEQTRAVFADEPWAAMKNETPEEYEMFKRFRDTTPHERPMLLHILAAEYGELPQDVKQKAVFRQWNYRASRYDLWKEASFRKGVMDKKRKLGSRLTELSESLLVKAEKAFELLEQDKIMPSYREAVEMARLGIELQRAGFGLTDVVVKNPDQDEDGGPGQFIEAAVQISAIVRRKLMQVEVDPNDIADGTIVDGDAIEVAGYETDLAEAEPVRDPGDNGDVP